MITLTKRQKQIYDFIESYIKKRGFSPTLEEIKKHFRLSSLSTIHQHIETLANKGYLAKDDNLARGISLKERASDLVMIPLLGTIAAGEPIEAIQQSESIAVPKSKIPTHGEVYALRVAGNSMTDENINDGDVVLVKQQSVAEKNQKKTFRNTLQTKEKGWWPREIFFLKNFCGFFLIFKKHHNFFCPFSSNT